jgi:hypothetical protein
MVRQDPLILEQKTLTFTCKNLSLLNTAHASQLDFIDLSEWVIPWITPQPVMIKEPEKKKRPQKKIKVEEKVEEKPLSKALNIVPTLQLEEPHLRMWFRFLAQPEGEDARPLWFVKEHPMTFSKFQQSDMYKSVQSYLAYRRILQDDGILE